MTRVLVRKTRPPDDVSRNVRVTVARPLPHDIAPPQTLEYTGPGGPRFDAQGMLLPHSILGNLEDFRSEMQLRGETELVQRIPDCEKQPPLVADTHNDSHQPEAHYYSGRGQSHALQHWFRHMTDRRRQQDFIARFLQKPAGSLLMNRSSRFRSVQEQRTLIDRGLAAVYTEHGRRVGSEFWSVPQHYGDEMSGITATLTQTERGNPAELTRIAQPISTRLETGDVQGDADNSVWQQSLYLQQRRRELKDMLRDFSPPDVDGLEVLGCGLPVPPSPLLDERQEKEEEEEQKENQDPLAQFDDIIMDVELRPALSVCGEALCWTGSSSSHQGQEGVSVRLMFETVTGQSVNADLELKNEGSTVIYYSWEKLTPTHTQHFYFNNTTAVILPSSTKHICVTFKSASAGILTEVWRLNTHPVLMGGASVHVILRGVALDQDKSAEQRAALQKELEQKACVCFCRRLILDLLTGVESPERPRSPDELYITDEERFHTHNPNLQFQRGPVEALQSLYAEVKRSEEQRWDLSIHTLTQVLLCVPESDESRETNLSRLNSLILELQRPAAIHTTAVTSHTVSLQLWRELIDSLVCESVRLRHTLGLQEHNAWSDTREEQHTLEQSEQQRAGVTRRRASVLELQEKSRAAEERGSMKKHMPEERNTDMADTDETLQDTYTLMLHKQVYVLMERMVDSLCDLLDDAHNNPQKSL